jgi:hypothetical protein
VQALAARNNETSGAQIVFLLGRRGLVVTRGLYLGRPATVKVTFSGSAEVGILTALSREYLPFF